MTLVWRVGGRGGAGALGVAVADDVLIRVGVWAGEAWACEGVPAPVMRLEGGGKRRGGVWSAG